VKTSTLVEVPTEKEIEEAVVMQDYEHHHVDFWQGFDSGKILVQPVFLPFNPG